MEKQVKILKRLLLQLFKEKNEIAYYTLSEEFLTADDRVYVYGVDGELLRVVDEEILFHKLFKFIHNNSRSMQVKYNEETGRCHLKVKLEDGSTFGISDDHRFKTFMRVAQFIFHKHAIICTDEMCV